MGLSELERATPRRDLLADDIIRLPTLFANLYAVGTASRWVLVDTGLPGFAGSIRRRTEQRFGKSRPEAIILTHGHWDHAGSALELAKGWDVPVYAHPLEWPYLTGKSDYAPKDPAVGGMIALMARFFPSSGYDLGEHVKPLPEYGAVPGMPEWRWIHTPGHTHGHVSLFRERDGVLLAGDAITTVNQDRAYTMIMRTPEFYRPPAPFTVDWIEAEKSIIALATLRPRVVGAGHGWPIQGPHTAEQFAQFARTFHRPRRGRYTEFPARADEDGIVALPPPVADRTGRLAAALAAGGVAALLIAYGMKRRRGGEQPA